MLRRSRCLDETNRLRRATAVVLLALAASPMLAMAASPAPGSPLDANDVLVASDSSSMAVQDCCIARDAAGDFVMVWTQGSTTTPTSTILIQRFDAAGTPQGGASQVDTPDIQPGASSVAMDAAGDFVVAWVSIGAPYKNAATYDVHVQRFSAAGIAQGGESLVSTAADFDDIDPVVAMDAAGDFVVVWEGQHSPGAVPEPSGIHQIYARRYDAAGTAQSDQFLVNGDAGTDQTLPDVAMDAAGDFVVAWQTGDQANLGYLAHDIQALRYDATGSARGGAFPLSTAANTGRAYPRVGMDAAGRFVVAWDNYDAAAQVPQAGVTGDVHAQRYDAAGAAQGSEFMVNTFTAGDQSGPSVTMDAAGDFAVAWQSDDQVAPDSNYDVYARRYSATGTPVDGEVLVNTSTAGSQAGPKAAMNADGDMVVAWSSYLTSSSIHFRRFAGEESVDLSLGATFASATPSPGSSFSMTLAVNNTSTTTPTGVSGIDAALDLALGVTGSITLPAGVNYQSAQGTDWTCAGPVSATLSCTYGVPLAAGSAAPPLTVMLTAPSAPGDLHFSAVVTSALKPDAGNTVDTSIEMAASGSGGGNGGSDPGGVSSGGGNPSTNSSGGSGDQAVSSGGGALDILSLAFLGLPLLARRRSKR
jgi:hypothetical protein